MRLVLGGVLFASSLVSVSLARSDQQPLQSEAGPFDAAFDAAFDAFVEDTLQAWHVPGLSVAVVDGGKTYSKVSVSSSPRC